MRLSGLFVGSICAASLCACAADATNLAKQTFEDVNRQRTKHHLPGLEWNAKLAALAHSHCERMMRLHFFSHNDPERGNVIARLKAAGVTWHAAAENLYKETGFPEPAESAVEGWMHSPGHRQNILDASYVASGIGVVRAPDGTFYFAQIFMR